MEPPQKHHFSVNVEEEEDLFCDLADDLSEGLPSHQPRPVSSDVWTAANGAASRQLSPELEHYLEWCVKRFKTSTLILNIELPRKSKLEDQVKHNKFDSHLSNWFKLLCGDARQMECVNILKERIETFTACIDRARDAIAVISSDIEELCVTLRKSLQTAVLVPLLKERCEHDALASDNLEAFMLR